MDFKERLRSLKLTIQDEKKAKEEPIAGAMTGDGKPNVFESPLAENCGKNLPL